MERGNILVFDSGVGGLSVLGEIAALRPDVNLAYIADTAFFPYGTRPEDQLIVRVHDVVHATIAACPFVIDQVVIACNTASTICLPRLRETLTIPVVGTVPAIKPAASMSQSRVIGLLGTPGTVRRHYTAALIDQFARDCTVIRIGSAALVTQAEQWLTGGTLDEDVIALEIAPFFANEQGTCATDIIVLACTHFPLLKPVLTSMSPRPVTWIDSGAAIARRCDFLLQQQGKAVIEGMGQRISWITGGSSSSAYAYAFERFDLAAPEIIPVPLPQDSPDTKIMVEHGC